MPRTAGTIPLTFDVPAAIRDRLKDRAKIEDRSLKSIALRAFEMYLDTQFSEQLSANSDPKKENTSARKR